MGVIFIFLAAVAVFVGIGVSRSRNESLNRAWGSVAARHGLRFSPASWTKSPRLDGTIAGHRLVADIHRKRTGKHSKVWTRFVIGIPAQGLGLQIKEESFLSAVAQVFGGQDIQVGDTAFDQRFTIKGTHEASVREFLDPARRAAIRRFFDEHPGSVITDSEIAWSKRGRIGEAARIESTIDNLVQLASVVAGGSVAAGAAVETVSAPGAAAGATVGESQATDDAATEVAAEELPQTDVAADIAVVEPAATDAAAGFEVGDWPEADAVADVAVQATPETTMAVGAEVTPASDPAIVSEPAVDAPTGSLAADRGPAPAEFAGPAIGEFCDEVFAPGVLSFEATRRFDSRYKGSAVTWSGVLVSAEPYQFDFDFGSGGGVRAMVKVHSLATASFGRNEVTAVLQLPANTDGLEAITGQPVIFAGKLLKVDGLSRRVFVGAATLS